MARRATELDAPVLVICGVHFMAETAAIANPDKTVLIPDQPPVARSPPPSRQPTCAPGAPHIPMDRRRLREHRSRGEGRVRLLLHSGNAVAVINALPPVCRSCFCPISSSAITCAESRERALDVWMGECHVHAGMTRETLEQRRDEYPTPRFSCIPSAAA